jgi:hypothetical protein
MDYQVMTRIESHAGDLFKLGQEQQEEAKSQQDNSKKLLPRAPPRKQSLADDVASDLFVPLGSKRSLSVPFNLSALHDIPEEEDTQHQVSHTVKVLGIYSFESKDITS